MAAMRRADGVIDGVREHFQMLVDVEDVFCWRELDVAEEDRGPPTVRLA